MTNLILPQDPVHLFLSLSLLTPTPGPCTGRPKVQQCRVETTELGPVSTGDGKDEEETTIIREKTLTTKE